jgi:glycerophosphoryl diester phosphodiesterase
MPPTLLSLDAPVVIAHRGGSALRPENTMAAFEHAASLGVDAFECDVHLSRDGEVVVIHDATLDRTTDARGPVSAMTADELSRVDAAASFVALDGSRPLRGTGVGVPRLADLLERFPAMPVVVEVKGERADTAERTIDVIVRAGSRGRVIVGGFSHVVLDAVRRLAPDIPTSASSREARSALRRSWCWLAPAATGARLFQLPLRLGRRRVLSRRLVRCARRAGLPVQAWVVDDPDEMRMLLDWGVTGIISDRPDVAMSIVGERRA